MRPPFGRYSLLLVVLLPFAAMASFSQSPAGPFADRHITSKTNAENYFVASNLEFSSKVTEQAVTGDNWPSISTVGLQPSFSSYLPHRFGKTDKLGKSLDRLPKPQTSSADSGWHFAFAPYLFAAGISGTVGARGRQLDIDANFGSVWDHLDIGFMSAFEVRKKRFISFNDLIWVKLSAEKDTPGRFYSTAKLGINLFIFDPEFGYRLIDSPKGTVDVLGGVRIWSVDTTIDVTSGVLPGFNVSERKTFAAPVIGVRGNYFLTPKFFLAGKFDIGGAGIGADITSQLYGAVGYNITKHVALLGGYRWLQVKYDDSNGFLFDTQMSGLMLGAKFSF